MYQQTTEENLKRLRALAGNTWPYVSPQPQGAERQQALLQMSNASLHGLDFVRGLKFAEEAVSLGKNLESLLLLGDLLYVNQRKEDAVQAWRRTLELKPNYTPALRRLIRHYEAMDKIIRPPEYDTWVARLRSAS